MVVAFYFRLHLAYFPRPVVAIFARPEQDFFAGKSDAEAERYIALCQSAEKLKNGE